MDKNSYDEVIPSGDKTVMEEDTVMGKLSSGYINRAAHELPKQGKRAPWQVTNNYLEDRKSLKDTLASVEKPSSAQDLPKLISKLEKDMKKASDSLQFELAAVIRDQIEELKHLSLPD